MKIGTAIERLIHNYYRALALRGIKKPVSWSLYQTWKWADAYEKERKDKSKR